MVTMSNSLIRELFRTFEASIHERMSILEEVISRGEDAPAPTPVSSTAAVVDTQLQEKIVSLETTLRELFTIQKTLSEALKESRAREQDMMDTITTLQSRIETLETNAAVAEEAEEEEDNTEEAEAEVAEAEEKSVEEEQAILADDDEEVEGEEGGLEGEEFTYKGNTYFRSTDNKVYIPDEDGAVDPDTPYGLWVANPKLPEGGKITRLPN
jgi:hypothetical protein